MITACAYKTDTYSELCCHILSQPVCFQAISAVKETEKKQRKMQRKPVTCMPFGAVCLQSIRLPISFRGWAAETLLQNTVPDLDQLAEGYYLYNQDGQRCGKYAAWTLKSRPDAVLSLSGQCPRNNGRFYAAPLLPAIRQQLAQLRQQAEAQGFTVQPISSPLGTV